MKYINNLLALCLSLACTYTIQADSLHKNTSAYVALTDNAVEELTRQNATVYVVGYDAIGQLFSSFLDYKTQPHIVFDSPYNMSIIEVFINDEKLENRSVDVFDRYYKNCTIDWANTRGFFFK